MSFLKKFKNRRLQIYLGVAIIICIILGVLSYIDKKKNVSDLQEQIVETYTIPESEKIFINGSVIPKQSKSFDVPAGTELSNVSVQDGQEVSKGALLFTSKNESIVTQIDSLKDQVEQLKKQKKNLPNTPENSTTIKSLESDINKLNKEMSTLNNKAYLKTTAPFDGKVYINDTESQEQSLEQPVSASFMSLESTDLFMKGQTNEQDFSKLQIDQTVDILVFSTNENLSGRISSISDRPSMSVGGASSQQSSSLSYYDVSIQFDSQEKLVNGFHLQASLKVQDSSFKIPASAIQEDEKGKKYVLKDIDGIVKKQLVDVSTITEDSAVVLKGLQENDIIIKFPTKDMKEGDPIPGSAASTGNTKDDGKIDNPFEDQPMPESEEDTPTVG